jgi:hypothetical protein
MINFFTSSRRYFSSVQTSIKPVKVHSEKHKTLPLLLGACVALLNASGFSSAKDIKIPFV